MTVATASLGSCNFSRRADGRTSGSRNRSSRTTCRSSGTSYCRRCSNSGWVHEGHGTASRGSGDRMATDSVGERSTTRARSA